MRPHRGSFVLWLVSLASLCAQQVDYVVAVADPAQPVAAVAVSLPAEGKDAVEVFLPVWSPGFYRVENYHQYVTRFTARTVAGEPLAVQPTRDNRWRIETRGAPVVVAEYSLRCDRGSVTHNQITGDFAVFCGPATFVTEVGQLQRVHTVRFELPAAWSVATGLPGSGEGSSRTFRARDYDWLVDSPFVSGTFRTEAFDVLGARHELVCFGRHEGWDATVAVGHLQPIASELCRLFGDVPFQRYVFLAGFRRANGGLEHLDSTLLSLQAKTPPGDAGFLSFVAHEYAHAFNVKRLRPVELGPFDYEHPPSTPSLWISEGLTTWFGDLAVVRAGAASTDAWLDLVSQRVRTLQSAPGRRRQTLADASLAVWAGSLSGTGGDPRTTISYYVKGPVVGLVLEARLRVATAGRQGLDDLIRLAYRRWSGPTGFTPQQFEAAAAEVAGSDQTAFFDRALRSTEELDYEEALEWFGLRFRPHTEEAPGRERWQLEPRPDATAAQRSHLAALLAPAPAIAKAAGTAR